MAIQGATKFFISSKNPVSILHSARTAVAALVSLLVARLLRLPEFYWAPISAVIVMQSTLGSALPISLERFAGTALGALAGGLVATYWPGNAFAFAAAVLLIGFFCAGVRVERNAYRYAGITLTIVMFASHGEVPRVMAVHRFTEVSVGIAIGLALSALWPERRVK